MVHKGDNKTEPCYQYDKRMKQLQSIVAIFISRASTFFPRNSGVRPTIKTADKYCDNDKCIMVHPPTPTPPPGVYLHVQHLHHTGQGHRRIVHAIVEPLEVTVVVMLHNAVAPAPRRTSLPSIDPLSCTIPISSMRGLPFIS